MAATQMKSVLLSRLTAAALMGLLVLMSGGPAQAAYSWMSKTHYYDPATNREIPFSELRSRAWSYQTVFDVTISLYNNPAGDDDWTKTSSNPDDSDQRTYEEIIKFWADSIYESTNGAHKLGTVRIFRKGKQSAIADVVWEAGGCPSAHNSGYGHPGQHIYFGDSFTNGCGKGCDLDLLNKTERSGYMLGHEWGHYVYGLKDEYRGSSDWTFFYSPRSTDRPVSPSIMNDATKTEMMLGNYEWLNFSTRNNIGDLDRTTQGRVYQASGWDTLARESNMDPKHGFYWSLPVRTHYNVLKNNQPTSWDNWVRTELPMERDEARDKLDIIWMADDFVMQVLIDRSGSMLGQPMENAKQGAKSLVDVVLEGLTAIGVVSFSDYATQDQPITRIPDPGAAVKTEIKEVIDGFTADGATAMYDAALGALFNLNVYCNTHKCKGPKVVFLLSDGMDTASSYTDGVVISEYQEARVPLFTLGYSEDSPGETLSTLAENTGGRFYYSPTTMDSIQAVFLAANCAVGALTGMASGSSTAPAGQNANFSCYVDPTIGSLSAVAGFTGEEGDVTFTWRGPKGLLSETVTCNPAGTNVSCFGSIPPGVIQSQGLGSYELLAANHTGNDIKVDSYMVGAPVENTRTYDITVSILGGPKIYPPSPVVILGAVSQGQPITGVELTAAITGPAGTVATLPMYDNGQNGDAIAEDGLYTGIWAGYGYAGNYSVEVSISNPNQAARFAYAGIDPAHSPTTKGGIPARPAYPPITTNFNRTGLAGFWLPVMVLTDDDSIAAAINLPPQNQDYKAGRIDSPGDVDYYQIQITSFEGNCVVRVTDMACGIDPVLEIYDENGNELGDRNDNQTSWNGYIYRIVPVNDGMGRYIYARVRDNDSTAQYGTYRICVGTRLPYDTTEEPFGTGSNSMHMLLLE